MTISTDVKKSIWQNSTFIHDKNSQQIGNERGFLKLIHGTYKKPVANLILNGERRCDLLLWEQGNSIHSHHCSSVLYWEFYQVQ